MIYPFIDATHLHYHTLILIPVQFLGGKDELKPVEHGERMLRPDSLESKANMSYRTEFQANLGFKARACFRGWERGRD